MIEAFFYVELSVMLAVGLFNLTLGLLGRLPSLVSLSAEGLAALTLIVQVGVTISLLLNGQSSRASILEFFGYLLVALFMLLGAAFWSVVERTKYSTIVLGAVPLVVCIMIARMLQLWVG
jgi:hypothetical protein